MAEMSGAMGAIRDCARCGEADATVDMTGDGWLMWCQECFDKAVSEAAEAVARAGQGEGFTIMQDHPTEARPLQPVRHGQGEG